MVNVIFCTYYKLYYIINTKLFIHVIGRRLYSTLLYSQAKCFHNMHRKLHIFCVTSYYVCVTNIMHINDHYYYLSYPIHWILYPYQRNIFSIKNWHLLVVIKQIFLNNVQFWQKKICQKSHGIPEQKKKMFA